MITKLFTILLFLGFHSYLSIAQDHTYSQFYDAPIYLNPALNGQFDGDFRANFIYRSQWTNLPGGLNYYTFSADLNLPKLDGGLGLMITKSSEGVAYFNKISLSGIYSYSVELENSILSFGLQVGATNRKIDNDKLIFIDQLNSQGIIGNGITAGSNLPFNNKYYFDSGTGANYVIGNVMLGASAQHLNRPNESLTVGVAQLPIRFNGYASWKISLNTFYEDSPSLIPSIVYQSQGTVSQFSAGLQYKHHSVNIGLWYRGSQQQNDAIVLSAIFDLLGKEDRNKIRLGFSHDASISKLPYSNTSGSTEGSLNYETKFNHDYSVPEKSYGNRCYHFY